MTPQYTNYGRMYSYPHVQNRKNSDYFRDYDGEQYQDGQSHKQVRTFTLSYNPNKQNS